LNGNPKAVIRTRGLAKDLPLGKTVVHALRGVDMDIYAREIVGIVGPSGSGKSTLLGADGGSVVIDGTDITRLDERRLTLFRRSHIGIIFQFFNLIPTLTAQENVLLPMQFARRPPRNPDKRAKELLDLLGLKDRMKHRPSELSGGQQQRVAIARALANNPPLLLADEPTGNLDTASGAVVLETLQQIRAQEGTTIVIVTHDEKLAQRADRVLTLVDGEIRLA
jgi:putative ABC transport system ATP-binding protein